ncbi:MAG TPA: hypothetical protein VNO14_07870, partial [Blastocatellia bacterium]|nr:hypothetical protein [Blastocatellia bacterium]
MKCIHCGYDSRYKERSYGRCPKCRKQFAFEPREGALLTDGAFKAAIDAVSSHGRIKWGVEHLYYEVCRRYRRKKNPPKSCIGVGIAAIFILFLISLAASSGVPAFFGLIIAGGLAYLFLKRREKTVILKQEKFNEMWSQWVRVHGTPPGLIIRQDKPARPRRAEPDLADYSFDRAVICDRARTVDLLLANNFHFENNCAVLAISGYPRGPFETVRAMLKRNPRLQVFVLHDASVEGCKTAYHLVNDPNWFKGHTNIIEVGLRPGHAEPFAGLLIASERGPVLPGEGITTEEAEWLSKYALELAAIRPEQVLKRLFRAINRKNEVESESYSSAGSSGSEFYIEVGEDHDDRKRGGEVEIDSDSFGSDASDSDGGADSF